MEQQEQDKLDIQLMLATVAAAKESMRGNGHTFGIPTTIAEMMEAGLIDTRCTAGIKTML